MAHRHVWDFGGWEWECNCVEGCEETLTRDEIERRLNAVECLSAAQAEHMGKRGPRGRGEIPPLLKYAAALEADAD
jgi:hypothetical protein